MAVFITSYCFRDVGTAAFLWRLEEPNPNTRRFKKRYFTFWNNYNIITDCFFLIGLIIRMLEYVLVDPDPEGNIAAVEAAGVDPCDAAADHWRHVHNRIAVGQPSRLYTIERHHAWLKRREIEG